MPHCNEDALGFVKRVGRAGDPHSAELGFTKPPPVRAPRQFRTAAVAEMEDIQYNMPRSLAVTMVKLGRHLSVHWELRRLRAALRDPQSRQRPCWDLRRTLHTPFVCVRS